MARTTAAHARFIGMQNPLWEAAQLGDVAACKLAQKEGYDLSEPDQVPCCTCQLLLTLDVCAVWEHTTAPRCAAQTPQCKHHPPTHIVHAVRAGYPGGPIPDLQRQCQSTAAQSGAYRPQLPSSLLRAQLGNTPLHLAAGAGDLKSAQVP